MEPLPNLPKRMVLKYVAALMRQIQPMIQIQQILNIITPIHMNLVVQMKAQQIMTARQLMMMVVVNMQV